MSGRFRGFSPSPSTAAASGIWSVRDVLVYRAAAEWPPAPVIPSPVSPVSPDAIAGLTGWWDASDQSTMFNATTGGSTVAAGGTVARWEDKSGAGRHFWQSTSSARPTYTSAARNSRGVLRFDGTSDWMASTLGLGGWSMPIDPEYSTCFVVAKASSVSTLSGLNYENEAVLSLTSGADGFVELRSDNTASSFGFQGTDYSTATVAYTPGAWAVFTTTHSSPTLSIKVNSNAAGSSTLGYRDYFIYPVVLGANYNASQFFDGDIGEIIVCNVALSAGDREAVESYLMGKWGIS